MTMLRADADALLRRKRHLKHSVLNRNLRRNWNRRLNRNRSFFRRLAKKNRLILKSSRLTGLTMRMFLMRRPMIRIESAEKADLAA